MPNNKDGEEVIEEGGQDLDIFISIIQRDGNGECLGYGCRGCHVEEIILPMWRKGFYVHDGHGETKETVN